MENFIATQKKYSFLNWYVGTTNKQTFYRSLTNSLFYTNTHSLVMEETTILLKRLREPTNLLFTHMRFFKLSFFLSQRGMIFFTEPNEKVKSFFFTPSKLIYGFQAKLKKYFSVALLTSLEVKMPNVILVLFCNILGTDLL